MGAVHTVLGVPAAGRAGRDALVVSAAGRLSEGGCLHGAADLAASPGAAAASPAIPEHGAHPSHVAERRRHSAPQSRSRPTMPLRRAQLSYFAAWTAEWAFTVALGIVAYRDGVRPR